MEQTGPGQVLIENPIINSPFLEPDRQFAFDETGITNQITPGRRRSSYFIPIAVVGLGLAVFALIVWAVLG